MTRSAVVVLSFLVALCCSAYATSDEFLTFQGLLDSQQVGNFYNGAGLPGTPNFGVSFSPNIYALWSTDKGGSGNYRSSQTPLGNPVIYVSAPQNGAAATGIMNATNGFSTGLNFYYSAAFAGIQNTTVTIWSGANGTGTVLASITLANNDSSCNPISFCTWTSIGALFSGTAHSVTFAGPANTFGLTDITLGSSQTAIPEPSTLLLVGAGLVGVSFGRVRRYFRP